MFILLTILCLVNGVMEINSARILAVYPIPSISHQVVFRPLMVELAKRGHEVVVITTDPAFPNGTAPKNLKEIDVHNVSYEIINNAVSSTKLNNKFTYEQAKYIFKLIDRIFEAQVMSEEVQKLINDESEKFDLIFIESFTRIVASFQYLYKVPMIEFSSMGAPFGALDTTGVSTNPLVYPTPFHHRINNLTVWEKISQLYKEYAIHTAIDEVEEFENEMARKLFGPNIPPLRELRKNVQMLFLNVNPIWDLNRPVSPNIIYLGGIHQIPSKDLPKDLKDHLDSSQNGVIYVSFGTNVSPSSLPADKIKIFTNVFGRMPFDILWKWDTEELPGRPRNVRTSKWFPQSDLLKHPKVKLFITQGGLQSTDEAITAGVPLIGIPFLADQWFNSEQYERFNIGLGLDIETITEDILENAITTIIDNPSYRENVVRLRDIMRDQPQSSLARAVWWTELVLRRGGEHLRAAAARLSWAEYYAVDVVLTLLVVFLIGLMAVNFSIRYVVSKLKYLRFKIKMH